jgi:hypothetical protein
MTVLATSRLRLIPIIVAQAFGIGCGIAGVKLNSTLLPPEVLGVYGVFLTLAPIGMWVVHAGLIKFTVRHWAAEPAPRDLLAGLARAWLRRLPWLAIAAVAGALALLQSSVRDGAVLFISLFLGASLLAAGALAQSALQSEGAHWKDCAVTVGGSLTRTFAPPLLYFATSGAVAALWLGFTFHTLVFAALGAWALRRYWQGTASAAADAASSGTGKGLLPRERPAQREVPPRTSSYRGPLFIALAAASWLLAGVNRWMVAYFFGETEAGYFTLMGGAATVLTSALGAVFVQYFQPGFFQLGDRAAADRSGLARRVDAVALAYSGAAVAAIVLLALAAPLLIGPLINPTYREAVRWIVPAGCFGIATITTVFYQSLLLAGRRERACAPVELTTAAVLVLGCACTAAMGMGWFARWLTMAPLVPWILTRLLARQFLFRPDAASAPEPVR